MTAREFFELVASMREFQKAYFKTRDGITLRKSMDLEKLVDNEILRVRGVLKESGNGVVQGSLFDGFDTKTPV